MRHNKNTIGLQRRGEVYYYRRRLPKSFARLIGKAEVVRSLGTSDCNLAFQRYLHLKDTVDRVIAQMTDLKPTLTDQTDELVRRLFENWLEADYEERSRSPDLQGWRGISHTSTDDDGANLQEKFARDVTSLTLTTGTHEIDEERFASLIRRVLNEVYCNIWHRRNAGDYSDVLQDRVLRQAFGEKWDSSQSADETELADLVSLAKAKEGFIRENRTALQPKTLIEYDQTFRLAEEFWGADMFVAEIDKKSAKKFRDLLLTFPANATQRFPGLKVLEVVDRAKDLNIPPVSTKTVNKKLSNLTTFFEWLKKQDLISENPFVGLSIRDRSSRKKKRDPFNPSQLSRIFSSGIYRNGHVSLTEELAWRDLEDFWIPLISLFTGMRLGEITQLATADIRQVQGVWVFEIHNRGDNHLKTRASERKVPVHQTLIDLGLLSYRDAVVNCNERSLFPSLPKASDGYESSAFSKRFARFLKKCGVKTDKRVAFHSFRHTMKDLLREAGVDLAVQNAICGHDDKSVAAQYGIGYTPSALHKKLHEIELPVDLRHLMPQRKPGGLSTHL